MPLRGLTPAQAFASARLFSTSGVLAAGLGWGDALAGDGAATALLGVAVLAGMARVAKQKHTPGDVLAGAALGVAFGEAFPALPPQRQWQYQMACVAYYTAIGALCLLGCLGAPASLTFRSSLGFKDKAQQVPPGVGEAEACAHAGAPGDVPHSGDWRDLDHLSQPHKLHRV